MPDAFSNPEYVRFAVRGGLACLMCDLLLVGFSYPGIYTSVITCFVVSLSTAGASTQKGTLRFAGTAVGGLMGILAMMYILPHVETLGGFWGVFAAGTAVAAWVNFGSPRQRPSAAAVCRCAARPGRARARRRPRACGDGLGS